MVVAMLLGWAAMAAARMAFLVFVVRVVDQARPVEETVERPDRLVDVHSWNDLDRLRTAAVSREDALVARYVLCTFVDTAVLNTPWGSQSDWASQSLLVMFHKEVSGGEKFFEILDRVRGNPARYIDLIELIFVCLALGYEGMYRHDPSGQSRLGELQHDLYRVIRDHRQLGDEDLSVHWKGVEDKRNPIVRYIPWWMVAAVVWLALMVPLGIRAKRAKARKT